MNKESIRFLIRLLFLTSVLGSGVILIRLFLKEYYFSMMPVLLILFSGMTFVTYEWLTKAGSGKMPGFTRTNMLVTFLRLFIYITVFVLCLVFSKTRPVVILVFTAILYFSFTVFEIYHLSKYLRINRK
jgi:hypothetical protein